MCVCVRGIAEAGADFDSFVVSASVANRRFHLIITNLTHQPSSSLHAPTCRLSKFDALTAERENRALNWCLCCTSTFALSMLMQGSTLEPASAVALLASGAPHLPFAIASQPPHALLTWLFCRSR